MWRAPRWQWTQEKGTRTAKVPHLEGEVLVFAVARGLLVGLELRRVVHVAFVRLGTMWVVMGEGAGGERAG